jgi:uncharacterized repeat protein (TIGR01451 family)
MRQRRDCAAWLCGSIALFLGLTAALDAQFTAPPPAPAAPPAHAAAVRMPPLLYLRLAGPKGMKVTLYRDGAAATFEAPCVIGVRPGYRYRFAISDVPGFRGATFYPTLDVHGSLWLVHQLRNADFPATILFGADDFAGVEGGAFIRKAVVLERPDAAVPIASRPDEPVELTAPGHRDLVQEATRHGAPLAVLYLGQRKFTPEEIAATTVPGTLLLPGETSLGPPRLPPILPWGCHPVHDPRTGPPHLGEWNTLYDGGDTRIRAGYNRLGQLSGVEPTDTVAEYTDPVGQRRIVPSNRVALCVPRFILLRTEHNVEGAIAWLAPGSTQSIKQGLQVTGRLGLVERKQPVQLEATLGRMKPSGVINELGTAVTGRINNLEVVATLAAIETLDGSCPPPMHSAPRRPLRIIKWPDRTGANVGDVVTFYLRYTNLGGEPITDVVVSDSLTTRFDYVLGSQQTDRAGNFTTQPNEAGSTMLRWEFPGALAPGASGTISFQVRIR